MKAPFATLSLLCGLLLTAAPVPAEVFKYIDRSGAVHFVDNLAKVPAEYQDQVRSTLPAISRVPGRTFDGSRATDLPARGGKKVEIFITAWCPHCRRLEAFLRANEVRYTSFDVERSAEGRREYQVLGAGGVPIIRVGKTILRGFNESELRSAIGLTEDDEVTDQ